LISFIFLSNEKAMKILVASHTYIVDLNREKLRALAKLEPGLEVTVVVPRKWRPGGVQTQTIISEFVDEGSFKVVPVSNFSQNHQGLLTFGWDLIKLLRDFRPDIIQVEQGSRALAYTQLILLNQFLGLQAKNCFFTWWNLPYTLKWPISWLEEYNLRHTDGLIVGNQDGADILRDRGYRGAIKIMPQLGVDPDLFCPKPQPELRRKLQIADDEFAIGFVGRFVEEKGLFTLLSAAACLPTQNWKLLLLGRGPIEEKLLATAKNLKIEDRLILVESVPHDRVPDYINSMDVLVLPSETSYKFQTLTAVGWKEQFGHVLIEAMACQVPVIGSNSGEIPHVIEEAGLVFPEKDIKALRDSLRLPIEKPEVAHLIAKRGYKRVMENYTNEALAKHLLSFYRELIKK
jgi:glycosyltransferase involved in cell wall biosynthesis